ncbi:diguanylate cyclase [Ketobacter sp. MCCC 1A13808]|uniref:diguanylate cyclase domain-containing protein n=1 Tax=Ketobacter sp. MCCC 1A13808 TaxID=2602738 RepID=UPI0012EB34B7|nr:diguanylate cyclase [Ketobacter sp. MCCC 1A13808]MVF13154.1 diguanylate cyclase [Ketobacter sp. MCCC 1A13808]
MSNPASIIDSRKNYSKAEAPRVLVVDDDATSREALALLLRHHDMIVSIAKCGKDALKMVQESRPDLVLLDVTMPEMDGYEVCRRLKADPETRNIMVIFLTGMTDSRNEERGLALGALDYITKPVVVPILKARIKNHLEMKRKNDLLTALARLDGLTNIPNRRLFDSLLHQEWSRSARHSRPMSLMMIDVDFFKRYNDTYGHIAGDDCLRVVARLISQCMKRSSDVVARYGGEEFVVLLPEAEEADTLVLAEKIRKKLLSLKIPHSGSPISDYLTVSIGCCTMTPNAQQSPQTLIIAADQNLYQAKESGRNKVVIEDLSPNILLRN